MIKKILTYCAEQLNSYLGRYYHRPQGLAEVGHIGQRTGEIPNKVIVSLVNVERETAGGISNNVQTYGGSFTSSSAPFLLNLKVMFAAVLRKSNMRNHCQYFPRHWRSYSHSRSLWLTM